MNNGAQGPPDGKSDCKNCVGDQCNSCNKSVPYSKAYKADSCGYDCGDGGNWIEGVYTRVHRDQAIINAMRAWMGLSVEEDPTKLGLGEHCAAKKFGRVEELTDFLQ
jgi:alpha-amylase